jgi:hypothetical protein
MTLVPALSGLTQSAAQTSTSGGGSPWLAHHALEVILAALLLIPALFSLRKWLRTEYRATSAGERLLYTLYATARVGMWFAFAGFFLGFAVVENPSDIRWYVMVPICLAGIQLLTGVFLGRSPSSSSSPGGRER